MEIRIRPAAEADFEAVNRLRRQVNDLHCAGRPDIFKPGFGEALRDHLRAYFASETNDLIVAEADGQIAGFAMVDYISRPASDYNLARSFYHVAEFGVDAPFRRQGIATALPGSAALTGSSWTYGPSMTTRWPFMKRLALPPTGGSWSCR